MMGLGAAGGGAAVSEQRSAEKNLAWSRRSGAGVWCPSELSCLDFEDALVSKASCQSLTFYFTDLSPYSCVPVSEAPPLIFFRGQGEGQLCPRALPGGRH